MTENDSSRTLGAREGEKRLQVMPVGGLKGFDVVPAKVSGAHQIGATPGENRPALPLSQHIRHQTRVPPIAVGEGVNHHQAMMKANRKVIGSTLESDIYIVNNRRTPQQDDDISLFTDGPIEYVEDAQEAVHLVQSRARPEDVVLVKGSRGMKMERISDALTGGQ